MAKNRTNSIYFTPNQDVLTGTSSKDYFIADRYSNINPATPWSWKSSTTSSIFFDPILGNAYGLELPRIDLINHYGPGDVIDLPANYGSTIKGKRGKRVIRPFVLDSPFRTHLVHRDEPGFSEEVENARDKEALNGVFLAAGAEGVYPLQFHWPAKNANFVYLCGRDDLSQPWIVGVAMDATEISASTPILLL